MSGYLKADNIKRQEITYNVDLSIPNEELLSFYQYIITDWLSAVKGTNWYNEFLTNLISGNIEEFAEDLQSLIDNTFSFRDTDKKMVSGFIMELCWD